MTLRVGIDSGGTFTDLVAFDSNTGRWFTAKVSSTPEQPLKAVQHAIATSGIAIAQIDFLILGTTVGTNALIQRRGAKVAYVTTEGFEDIPFIQRGNRKFHYDLHWIKPRPFLERHQCLGVKERMDYRGNLIVPLNTNELGALERAIGGLTASEGLESVAVSLLFSFRNPSHEKMLGKWLADRFPDLSVSLSHQVAPVWREYERGLTTIADAYLKPLLGSFIREVDAGLCQSGFRGNWALMKSNGGTQISREAAHAPVQLLLSGLAGGVIGGKHFGLAASRDLITLDMGGTSCDIAVIQDGEQRYADKFEVEFGLPLTFPTIEVTTIGAGGGSLAWIDRGGFLRVGPESAGARPGPACYGRGGEKPTVTDANLILGRLDPEYFLGGQTRLDNERARAALVCLSKDLQMPLEEAAVSVLEIADENMANAIRVRTVELGIDPRGFSLVAFGGAGGLHASSIARKLEIRHLLIPPHPGLCSAFGALTADLRSDQMLTASLSSGTVTASEINVHLKRLAGAALKELASEKLTGSAQVTARLAMRYLGQNYEHEIEVPGAFLTDASLRTAFRQFEALHDKFYGYHLGGETIEIVTISVTALGPLALSLPAFAVREKVGRSRRRSVYFRKRGVIEIPAVPRATLSPARTLQGPALVEEPDSTILLLPGDHMTVLANGSLSIRVDPEVKP